MMHTLHSHPRGGVCGTMHINKCEPAATANPNFTHCQMSLSLVEQYNIIDRFYKFISGKKKKICWSEQFSGDFNNINVDINVDVLFKNKQQ